MIHLPSPSSRTADPTSIAMHDAVADSTAGSGDLVWNASFPGGNFGLAIRLPVGKGSSIALAPVSKPLGGMFEPPGSLTGGAGAATWVLEYSGSSHYFQATGASGTVDVIEDEPLLVQVHSAFNDATTSETATVDALVTFAPLETHNVNCN